MTSIAQVTALVDAHVHRDHDRFRAVTLQIAANLASRSGPAAEQLRKLVEKPHITSFTPLPSANGLLSAPSELASLDDMILTPLVRDRLDRVVLEHAQRDVLRMHSLRPASKMLFVGPPGVGKSMAAGALARAVELPLFRVELHGVIASHLGETSANLAKVFDHVRTMPAVYLFDEFDALGTDRSLQTGTGADAEMRRVVNSLLQFIEDDRSDSLIVAATNHGQRLDRAIFRRFDETIVFAIPAKAEVEALARRTFGADADQLNMETIYAAVANPKLGHADLCAALDQVHKDQLLVGAVIDTAAVVDAVAKRVREAVEAFS